MQHLAASALVLALLTDPSSAGGDDLLERVEHGYAENGDVRIHFARLGDAEPLIVMIHGFPDWWYTWRHQMDALAREHTVVAMDLRGYNRSDRPSGVEAYAMRHLVGDVLAVIRANGRESATVIGHDWGAAIAWQLAMNAPRSVERLVILSVPHPAGFGRELRTNPEQHADSQYARDFQRPDGHASLTAEGLARWVRDAEARERYVEAFERSDFEAMTNYYRANFPSSATPPDPDAPPPATPSFPRIGCPVLVLHGLKDRALHASGHDGTWDWIDADTTLVMLPDAGHFLQHDRAERVTRVLRDWLAW